MDAHDYRRYDIRDAHEAAPRFTEDGFRLELGLASDGRRNRAAPFAGFGVVAANAVLAMAQTSPPLNAATLLLFLAVLAIAAALLGLGARVMRARATIVCEHGLVFAERSWAGGQTEAWDLTQVHGFVAHVRALRWTEPRSRYATEYMAWSVSAEGATGRRLDLDLSLRPEQAERVARDLGEALSELRAREASRRGFRG